MIALAANSSQAMMPVVCPSPKPRETYSSNPAAEGYRAPNLAKEYPCNMATAPAIRKESHTAARDFSCRPEQSEDAGSDHRADPDERSLAYRQLLGRSTVHR